MKALIFEKGTEKISTKLINKKTVQSNFRNMNSSDGVVYVIRDCGKDEVVTKDEWESTAHRAASSCIEKAIPPVVRYAIGVVVYCIVARILFMIEMFFSLKYNFNASLNILLFIAVIILSVAITHNIYKLIFKIIEIIRQG